MDVKRSAFGLLMFCLGLCVMATSPIIADESKPTHFTVKIHNKSVAFSEQDFYLLATGQDDTVHDATINEDAHSFVQFDTNGVGTLVHAVEGMTGAPYTVRLSALPADASDASIRILKMPRLRSGRVYLSLGKPPVISVVMAEVDLVTGGKTHTPHIGDPNVSSDRDPNFYTLFDKFEMSFLTADKKAYINTTSVDFVSLPLSLREELADNPDTTEVESETGELGYIKSRSEIAAALLTELTGDWTQCIQSLDGVFLRVLAPNKALDKPYLFRGGSHS